MKRKFASIFATAAATVTSLSYGAMNPFAEAPGSMEMPGERRVTVSEAVSTTTFR